MADASEIIHVTILGDGGVGKTATLVSWIHQHFVESYQATVEELYRKQVTIEGNEIQLELLDTAGQEEMRDALQDQWVGSGDGFVIVYAVNAESTFEEASKMYKAIIRATETREGPIPIVLVGNKCDLDDSERQVSREQGEELAAKWGVPFFETSAKDSINIEEAFMAVAESVWHVRHAEDSNNPCECVLL